MRPAQKARERYYLDCFLASREGFALVEHDHESPAFILEDRRGRVGLEVRQAFRVEGRRGSHEKAQEAKRDAYLRAIADAYYAAPGAAPIALTTFERNGGARPCAAEVAGILRVLRPAARGQEN